MRTTSPNERVKGNFPACAPQPVADLDAMYVAWTTVANDADARNLATSSISHGFAVCVQVDGPISSYYLWKGQLEVSSEFRLSFKCTKNQLSGLERHVLAHHPYETPEWVVVRAERVGEKYLSWANASSTNPTL